MGMRILVDWQRCDGNGICVTESPETFQMTDDDELILLAEQPDEALRPKLAAAVASCPKRALAIEG
jgi:ferredoxin